MNGRRIHLMRDTPTAFLCSSVMAPEPDASLERQIGMRASVVLLALAVAGCASGSYASGQAPAASPRHSPALVSVQVNVPSRTMEAGSSMLAHIIVDNRTGHAIHAQGCGSLFALALGSSSHPARVAWSACLQILTIAIGKSSYPETITASYDSCGGPGLPACLPDGRLPLLPAGEYRVVFFQLGHIVSAPAPIPVRVTPRSLHPALLELKGEPIRFRTWPTGGRNPGCVAHQAEPMRRASPDG